KLTSASISSGFVKATPQRDNGFVFNLTLSQNFWQETRSLSEMKPPFEFRPDTDYDVAGFGTNAVDHLIGVAEYPAFNSKVELTNWQILPGGEVASTLVALQRLDFKTAYAGRFGSDEAGKLGLRSLVDEGINVDHAEVVSDARTQVAFIIVDERTGERTIIWKRDPKLRYSPDNAPLELGCSAKILHMTPHDTAAAIRMAGAARDAATIVSLDIDNTFDGLDDLLALTDIMIASSDLLERLTGTRDKLSAMTGVASRYGCRIVGVTLGDEGSNLLCDGVFIDTPAFEVPGGCVDTTGAGDAFRAGFLYGLLSGYDVERAGRSANAVAALECRKIGARAALPDLRELTTLLKIR
ncbi:MAG TPA: carbohydrate kinase family protein, partial [Pyrinomonadaceae bacterium]